MKEEMCFQVPLNVRNICPNLYLKEKIKTCIYNHYINLILKKLIREGEREGRDTLNKVLYLET